MKNNAFYKSNYRGTRNVKQSEKDKLKDLFIDTYNELGIVIQDDILYVAMYTGGLRVVDISGDLVGDLYKQGREMGYLLTGSPEGYIPNDTMVWGAQLYKGHVFYSDFNTGLGAAKVSSNKPDNSKTNKILD